MFRNVFKTVTVYVSNFYVLWQLMFRNILHKYVLELLRFVLLLFDNLNCVSIAIPIYLKAHGMKPSYSTSWWTKRINAESQLHCKEIWIYVFP